MCILKGNLAPDGCVVKHSAATERLLHHRGPAKVFDDLSSAEKWLADENSDVDENTVIVLRGYGPKGHPDIRRGFIRSFIDHVQQANDGCDLDYLTRE